MIVNKLSIKFQTLVKTKIPSKKEVSSFKSLRCCINHAKNVKMPTIVGILTFMSRIIFVLSRVAASQFDAVTTVDIH